MRKFTLLAVSFLFAAAAPVPSMAQPVDAVPRIAVMSAFQPEWVELQAELTGRQEQLVNGTRFVTGQLSGRDVVLFLSGVSMVNAAMTTQLAADRFDLRGIVFSGIAGGVDPALSIGDVVVADQWGQYLESAFARETEGSFSLPPFLGASPFANYGMIFPRNVELSTESGDVEERFWFPVDETMLQTARTVAEGTELERCTDSGSCLDGLKIVVGGNGVSGSVFVDNAAFREYVFQTFEAKVLDMESAAVAHVAHANQVPFIAFRSLSDLAGGGDEGNEMAIFMDLASSNSAKVVRAFLAALPRE